MEYDAVVVGSGINSLSCAGLLAHAGWRVCVLERSDHLGGAVHSAEITLPGFVHDVFASWHGQWTSSPAWRVLRAELQARGVRYVDTDLPAATVLRDGSAAFLLRSTEANVEELARYSRADGRAWADELARFDRIADLLVALQQTELHGREGALLGLRALRRFGPHGIAAFTGHLVGTARDWLTDAFVSEQARGLLAPWVLHTGTGPEAATSAPALQAVVFGKQRIGSPTPVGGGSKLVDAIASLVRDRGGAAETGCDVEQVLVRGRRAVGVRLAGGDEIHASRAVVCNVTPDQLYGRLLSRPKDEVPRFRYGRALMQIHYALDEPARWNGDRRLERAAVVHVTSGLDGVSRAVAEAERGLLPAEPTITVGQPLAVDPSRAPTGKGILWVQLLELPRRVRGDAADEITTGSGSWTPELREAYADRVESRLSRHIPSLPDRVLARRVISPADLAAANVNLVDGDPYSGARTLDQNLFWRPGHRTGIDRLWRVGASTHPGPGLSGASGTMVARRLLRRTPFHLGHGVTGA